MHALVLYALLLFVFVRSPSSNFVDFFSSRYHCITRRKRVRRRAEEPDASDGNESADAFGTPIIRRPSSSSSSNVRREKKAPKKARPQAKTKVSNSNKLGGDFQIDSVYVVEHSCSSACFFLVEHGRLSAIFPA